MREREAGRNVALICRVETRFCAIAVEQVSEIMRPLPIEPLAAMPRFVRGVAVVRGAPIPVVDAAMLLGAVSFHEPGRFVALRAFRHLVVLAVDDVLGLRDISAASIQDLPPLLREGSGDIASTIGTLDAALLVVLQAARVFPESAWSALDAGGAVT
jgi:purine-binding chemotaxis protein CheW